MQHLTLRNLSTLSIRQSEQGIRFFVAWLEGKSIPNLHGVGRETFEQYKAELMASQNRRGMPLNFNTVRGRLFIVQRWFAYLKRKGFIITNPIENVKPPPRVKRLPRGVMSTQEIAKVMAQPDLKTLVGYRDRTLMEVLYSTGMRAAEVSSIEVQDVNLEKKVARVRKGKGAKERFVPLTTPCCRFLERYLAVVRPELAQGIRPAGNNWLKKYQTGGNLLFLSAYGGHLQACWLTQLLRGYLTAAGITRPISPVHGFRHTVATHLMESGMDVRYVQVFLGHANINTTQIYTHVERKSMMTQLKSYHPLEKAGNRLRPFAAEEEDDD
ncbi:MAG: tyrosine-type recombinase/integrase [Elusimicrobia bacterium]|nr:tyrosine-type recombinase/integrase [Elusimicrobiota bacterium]